MQIMPGTSEHHTMREFSIFLIGLVLFVVIACFGWNKLRYGFNFIDEGYHMAESWRLTQGDDLLDNKAIGPLMPFTLVNSLVFRLHPEITLLGFRQLQFVLTMMALFVFGLSLYAFTRNYWHLPIAFSLFAFTGIDPTGMISNLSYHTYPHLFLTLHLALLLLGLAAKTQWMRRICLIFSGLFLFGIGFSLLYLNTVAAAPILIYLFFRKGVFRFRPFAFSDLLFVLVPYATAWLVFFGWQGPVSFFTALKESLSFILSTESHNSNQLMSSLLGTGGYLLAALMMVAVFFAVGRLPLWLCLGIAPVLSVVSYFVVETSFFGVVQPYYNGWFGRPMWLAALIMAFVIFFWSWVAVRLLLKKPVTEAEALCLIILTPVTLQAACTIVFSGLNALTVLHAAIPAMAAMSFALLASGKTFWRQLVVLFCMVTPFYFTTAWADWRFTFFDVAPEQMNAEISKGFGKGIKTNGLYAKLNDWILYVSDHYSKPDDYILSYVTSSMTYMITKRRPALNDTFTDLSTRSSQWYGDSIRMMQEHHREPAIAFIFERMPALFLVSLEQGTVSFSGKQLNFQNAMDPISQYIKHNMIPGGDFIISKKGDHVIRCYINPKLVKIKTSYGEHKGAP